MSGIDIAGLVLAVAGLAGNLYLKVNDFRKRMKDYDRELENLTALCKSIQQDIEIIEPEVQDGTLPGAREEGNSDRPTSIDGIHTGLEELKVLLSQLDDEMEMLKDKDTSGKIERVKAQKEVEDRMPVIERIQKNISFQYKRLHFHLWLYFEHHHPDNSKRPISKPADVDIASVTAVSSTSSQEADSHNTSENSSRDNSPNTRRDEQEPEVIKASRTLDLDTLRRLFEERSGNSASTKSTEDDNTVSSMDDSPVTNATSVTTNDSSGCTASAAQERDKLNRTLLDVVIYHNGARASDPRLLDVVELLLEKGAKFTMKDEEQRAMYCDIKSVVEERKMKRSKSKSTK